MDTLSFKTISANKATVQKEWVLVDATDMVLGRMASRVAKILRGKYKPNFTPHVDCGDNVIIINAAKVKLTLTNGKIVYITLIPYIGWTTPTRSSIVLKVPKDLLKAVKGMLPKNILGSAIIKNLYVYAGAEHPHELNNKIN